MICESCREGGTWNSRGNVVSAGQGAVGAYLIQAIANHAQCKGDTWCDCQHVVGRTARAGREAK